jgi:hypothetical protein
VLGVFNAAIRAPLKIAAPALPEPEKWMMGVILGGILVVTVTTFVMCGTLLYGLRGQEA